MKKGDKVINVNKPKDIYTVDNVGYYVTTVVRVKGKRVEDELFTNGDKDWVLYDGSKIKLTRQAICNAFNCVDFVLID